MKKLHLALAATLLLSPTIAFAATQGAVFTGIVPATCILVADDPGTVAPNADFTTMSSDNAGGSPSTVIATATGSSFDITTEAPAGFSAGPSDANTNTSFTSSYSLSGATISVEVDGAVPADLNVGASLVTVDMAATKSSGVFSSGPYTATVTVRCE